MTEEQMKTTIKISVGVVAGCVIWLVLYYLYQTLWIWIWPALLIAGVLFYMLPSFIAAIGNKKGGCLIFAINILLGWSLIGWFVALAWALVADRKD